MAFQKGNKLQPAKGRPKGALGKLNRAQAACEKAGVDPFQMMAQVVAGNLPCGTCFGKGKTKYKLPDGLESTPRYGMRTCESCYGSKREKINTETRLRAASDLAQYLGAKLKALEITGTVSLDMLTSKLAAGKERIRQAQEGK